MSLVGLEHEYLVRRGGVRVDFRSLLHRRPIPGRRLDPADPHAYRLISGLKLTADGREAEVASPPVELVAGCTDELQRWAAVGAATLGALFPEFDLTGESTHLSVSIPDESALEVGGLFARAFGPALMLLMDDQDSPGMLIRPRAGRLELAAEYCHGERLAAAAALAIGGVTACVAVAEGRRSRRDLPSAARMEIVPAVDRWGWYLDRAAFGVDLVTEGRGARLDRERRGSLSGQDVLEGAWKVARETLAALVGPRDLVAADDAVFGFAPLPGEVPVDRSPAAGSGTATSSPEGAIVETLWRPSFTVRPHVLTWDFAVLEARAGSRSVFLSVPRTKLIDVTGALRDGSLDAPIAARLAQPTGTELRSRGQALQGGMFDSMAPPQALAAPERDVFGVMQPHPVDRRGSWPPGEAVASAVMGAGAAARPGIATGGALAGGVAGARAGLEDADVPAGEDSRFGKNPTAPVPALIDELSGRSWMKGVLAAGAIALAGLIGFSVFGGGGDDPTPPDAVPGSTLPLGSELAPTDPVEPTEPTSVTDPVAPTTSKPTDTRLDRHELMVYVVADTNDGGAPLGDILVTISDIDGVVETGLTQPQDPALPIGQDFEAGRVRFRLDPGSYTVEVTLPDGYVHNEGCVESAEIVVAADDDQWLYAAYVNDGSTSFIPGCPFGRQVSNTNFTEVIE